MNIAGKSHSRELLVVMRMFQAVCILGLVYCLLSLAADSSANGRLVLYVSWFAVASASAEAILNWLKLGVYILVAATAIVTVVEVISGTATLGGASLGLLVAFVMVVYLRPEWSLYE